MKVKKYWVMGAVAICLSVFWAVKVSAISNSEKIQLELFEVSTLYKLKAVEPIVIIEAEEAKLIGVNKDSLQTEVELMLRKARIKIDSAENKSLEDRVEIGRLTVSVDVREIEFAPIYCITTHVELRQYVTLLRYTETRITTRAVTWPLVSKPEITFAGKDAGVQIRQAVSSGITQQMNNFCNEYLAANPKDQPKNQQK
jgi:hypothetical protein